MVPTPSPNQWDIHVLSSGEGGTKPPPPRHRVHNCHGRIDTLFGSRQCNVRLTITPDRPPQQLRCKCLRLARRCARPCPPDVALRRPPLGRSPPRPRRGRPAIASPTGPRSRSRGRGRGPRTVRRARWTANAAPMLPGSRAPVAPAHPPRRWKHHRSWRGSSHWRGPELTPRPRAL